MTIVDLINQIKYLVLYLFKLVRAIQTVRLDVLDVK